MFTHLDEIANALEFCQPVTVTFTKADGTERVLKSDTLGPDGYFSPTHVTLMDKEINEYRNIRGDSITHVAVG
jgi:hypothetical protein